MLTKQEIFTKVYETLRERGFTRAGVQLLDEEGEPYFTCKYRSPVGPCAIGIFIEDAEYSESFEGTPAADAIDQMCAVLRDPLKQHGSLFFYELQEAHDNGKTPELMQEHLNEFAAIHNLEIPS